MMERLFILVNIIVYYSFIVVVAVLRCILIILRPMSLQKQTESIIQSLSHYNMYHYYLLPENYFSIHQTFTVNLNNFLMICILPHTSCFKYLEVY